jgi:hypothetical protein
VNKEKLYYEGFIFSLYIFMLSGTMQSGYPFGIPFVNSPFEAAVGSPWYFHLKPKMSLKENIIANLRDKGSKNELRRTLADKDLDSCYELLFHHEHCHLCIVLAMACSTNDKGRINYNDDNELRRMTI